MQIETNLAELNKAIQDYARLSGKTIEEALQKQAAKLGFSLKQELRGLAPAKGSIREQLLDRLGQGLGIRVSQKVLSRVYQSKGARSQLSTGQTIFGKKGITTTRAGLNLWALAVKAEIARRESARGFLGVSASYRGLTATLETQARALSRYGPVLSTAGFKATPGGGSIEFQWGPEASQLSGSAAEGINKPKGEAAVNRALSNTLDDIQAYIDRKLGEQWSR